MSDKNFYEYTLEELFFTVSLYDCININFLDFRSSSRAHDIYFDGQMIESRLYETTYSKDFQHLINLMKSDENILGYCTECMKELSLKVYPIQFEKNILNPVLVSFSEEELGSLEEEKELDITYIMDEKINILLSYYRYFEKTIVCTHCDEHIFKFTFHLNIVKNKANEKTIVLQKIGQYPSLSDFNNNKTKKYEKLLKSFNSYDNYKKSNYMYSHGLGIGSYAYLRRVLEDLVLHKYNTNQKSIDSDLVEFKGLYMNEKLKKLKNYLPSFLVENKEIHKILSIGIHDLSEELCLKIFPTLKISIEIILDEELKSIEERKIEEKTSKALSDALSNVKDLD